MKFSLHRRQEARWVWQSSWQYFTFGARLTDPETNKEKTVPERLSLSYKPSLIKLIPLFLLSSDSLCTNPFPLAVYSLTPASHSRTRALLWSGWYLVCPWVPRSQHGACHLDSIKVEGMRKVPLYQWKNPPVSVPSKHFSLRTWAWYFPVVLSLEDAAWIIPQE